MGSGWILTFAALFGWFQQPMRVVVNLPAYRLEAFVADSLVRTASIAPGMPRYPTPRGSFAINSIEWNPWWIPPNSPWAAKERPTPPGPTNPMGRVKLNFRPMYFLHGTPAVSSIGTAASHGCIRMRPADAIDLARLVHRYGTPLLSEAEVDRLAADSVTTRELALDDPIPIEIRYDLVEIRAGRVLVYRDIYGLSRRSLRAAVYDALLAHGVDTARVDSASVRRLIYRVPQRGASMALDSIMVSRQ